MDDDLNERVGVLTRREIEARALAPFVRAVAGEIGDARARELLAGVVREAARRDGRAMRARAERDAGGAGAPFPGAPSSHAAGEGAPAGPADLRDFARRWEPWIRGGALEIEQHELGPDVWRFDVVRCRYAELYRDLGLADLGGTLSCARDAALVEGFDGGATLARRGTLMEGAPRCDFLFRRPRAGDEAGETAAADAEPEAGA